jgi:hydrogenase nickel incorporation protein HypB
MAAEKDVPSPLPDAHAKTSSIFGRALVVALVGPPGCGKTSLIETTVRECGGRHRIAVITVNPAAQRDAQRLKSCCEHVQAVATAFPQYAVIAPAVGKLPMDQIDLLLIESMGGISEAPDFRQDHMVCVLSVSGGDDKAAEYAQLVGRSSAVVLSKVDLLDHVSFDRRTFASDIVHVNPTAEMIELSVLDRTGVDRWIGWLNDRRQEQQARLPKRRPSQPEWFIG